jgi:dCTP deaminase
VSVLADAALRRCYTTGQQLVAPLRAGAIQPSSIDLTLGSTLKRLDYGSVIDPAVDQSHLWREMPLRADGRWLLGQGALYLGVTDETVTVPANMLGLLHGVSSLGRLGLLVHITAGVCDPGYSGRLTLELVSLGGAMYLEPGQRVAQLTFQYLTTPAQRPYDGRYQNDTDAVVSRSYRDWSAAE